MAAVAMPLATIPTPSISGQSSTPIATASGLLALLSEPDPTLVQHALTKLLSVVDTLWHEVAEALPDLEAIAEGGSPLDLGGEDGDEMMAGDLYDEATKQTAAALASRVFFHLEEPRQALRLALESGEAHFNVLNPNDKDGPYVERMVNAAIGEYVARKQKEFDGDSGADGGAYGGEEKKEEEEEEELDMAKLQTVVQLMFQRCYLDKSYGHALGVAFEARECDKVQEILDKLGSRAGESDDGTDANSVVEILKGALNSAYNLIPNKAFRNKALGLIATSLQSVFDGAGGSKVSDKAKRNAAFTLALCRQLLGDATAVGEIIVQLIDASEGLEGDNKDDSALLGLQLCFDIVDSGDQAFVTKVAGCLPNQAGESGENADVVVEGSNAEGGDNVEVDSEGDAAPPAGVANERGVEVETSSSSPRSESTWAHFANAHRILTGGFTSELSLSFLYKNSNSDVLIMSNLKKALEERSMSRNSVLHNCAVTTHGRSDAVVYTLSTANKQQSTNLSRDWYEGKSYLFV